METKQEKDIDMWLEETKNELMNNIDLVIKTSVTDRETLEIMKNLIQTMKVSPTKNY